MKFEFDPDEPDEQVPGTPPTPDAASPEENAATALPPDFRMHRAFDHARTRARVDMSRVRSALNQMNYTVQVAHSEEQAAETFDAPTPDVFRPEAFRARTSN